MLPDYPGMDIATARALVPKFGDPTSIKARDVLGMASELGLPKDNGRHVIDVTCEECGGSGECICGTSDCCHCRGQGTVRRLTEIGKMHESELYTACENKRENDEPYEPKAYSTQTQQRFQDG